jgi:hypothetical protein
MDASGNNFQEALASGLRRGFYLGKRVGPDYVITASVYRTLVLPIETMRSLQYLKSVDFDHVITFRLLVPEKTGLHILAFQSLTRLGFFVPSAMLY